MDNLRPCEHGIWPDQAGGHQCGTLQEGVPQLIAEPRASVVIGGTRPATIAAVTAAAHLARFAAMNSDKMSLSDWAGVIHEWAVRKGWWPDGGRNGFEILALVHSEISEAVEHLREGNFGLDYGDVFYHQEAFTDCPCGGGKGCKPGKPDGYAIEMIDAVIRILDDLAEIGADPDELIAIKMAYNETRPYRHGGKLA